MNTFESKIVNIPDLLVLLAEVREQTLKFFGQPMDQSTKADNSPVTEADIKNHELLTKRLPEIRSAPVWSEEDYPTFENRRSVHEYWLIDPLDGTKEFTKGISDFSVLVALMRDGRPVFSAISIPAKNEIFFAEAKRGFGYYKNSLPQSLSARSGGRFSVGLLSRFHEEPEVSAFYEKCGLNENLKVGSALKFCALVTDDADAYFRHKGPHEWDVAAGDLLIQESGGVLLTWPDRKLIQYNQETTRVPAFLALRKSARGHFPEGAI